MTASLGTMSSNGFTLKSVCWSPNGVGNKLKKSSSPAPLEGVSPSSALSETPLSTSAGSFSRGPTGPTGSPSESSVGGGSSGSTPRAVIATGAIASGVPGSARLGSSCGGCEGCRGCVGAVRASGDGTTTARSRWMRTKRCAWFSTPTTELASLSSSISTRE